MSEDARAPMWRGAQYFRALSVAYAIGRQIVEYDRYERIGWSWVVLGCVIAFSVVAAVAYVRGFGRTVWFVVGEFIVVTGLVLATWAVASMDFTNNNQSLPTTLWMTNPVISAAILAGPISGIVGGLVVAAVNALYRDEIVHSPLKDANYPVMAAVGLGIGVAARVATRSHEQVREAERIAADARARERLAREVHDGVLQALAFIARRCAELGGTDTEVGSLGQLAATQERALRRLIAETPDTQRSAESDERVVDLRDLLRPLVAHSPGPVTLAEPGGPVALPAQVAAEIAAAARNALDNTVRHAGPEVAANLLVEDLGESVVVTVRDDGPGIPPGRLDEARSEGRLGVAESIVGRMRALGGRAELTTGVDEGVEWELWVPKT